MIDAADTQSSIFNHGEPTKRGGLNPNWREINPPPAIDSAQDKQTLPVLTAANEIKNKVEAGKEAIIKLTHDELTGAKSREFYSEYKKNKFDRERDHHKVAVIVVDLDNFKNINDTMGHDAGDQALKELAVFFKSFFRQGDQIVQLLDEVDEVTRVNEKNELVRFGGDEFLIVCSNMRNDPNFETDLNEKMLQLQKRTDKPVNFSFGIAIYDKNKDQGLEQTQIRADKIMYQNKEGKKSKLRKLVEIISKIMLGTIK